MASVIELTNVTKQFGDVTALRDVDLAVEKGEVFGFLGPNGAGKSTTIDMLLDFIRPTGGEIRVLGMEPKHESVELRKRVGILPDGYHVYDRLTGRQHVQFAIDSKAGDDDPMALLERVGIADAADRKAGGYSKGMTQRLVLAMALAGDPDLLVLDEPTTGLDPAGAREMREIIREEVARGATVFFSSHILEQVEAVCDRVAILNRGELVAVDTIDNLRESVGDGATLTVTVDAEPTAETLDAIEALPGISSVGVTGTTITVHCISSAKTAVLDAIEATGLHVSDFTTERTSLEDLFLKYTGNSDEPAESGDDAAEPATDAAMEVEQ
ncbi:ABC transporter ATP-binding protein [Haloarchaeobius iranensis]|uniref:ABC-2 type transport system ATP-binding protein n=1 Tax=Haloarchaeobius iranensis TaxID=996166 RepID=A0A1G9VIN7_9EURY|nr:ABC transporter ATP-binding protein [Haloarchaeobius iranensis]SDM71943.1 ABC-2 type transport system ATP-binding protein [Haloarchaeobius iranensis]